MDHKSKVAKNNRNALDLVLKTVKIEQPKVVVRKVADKR